MFGLSLSLSGPVLGQPALICVLITAETRGPCSSGGNGGRRVGEKQCLSCKLALT